MNEKSQNGKEMAYIHQLKHRDCQSRLKKHDIIYVVHKKSIVYIKMAQIKGKWVECRMDEQ